MAEAHIVDCRRCGRTAPGLARPPLSGEVGQLVFENTCEDCWADWFEQQIGVINHYGLTPAIREDRLRLYDVMKEFLALSDA